MKINIQFGGLFLSAEQGGGIDTRVDVNTPALVANRTEAGVWETFELIHAPDADAYFIKTCDGWCITAEGGGGSFLRTNEKEPGVWETFFIYENGIIVCWDRTHVLGVDNKVVNAVRLAPKFNVIYLEEPQEPADRTRPCASYCSHRDQQGDVVFDPLYFGILWDEGDITRIDACMELKHSMGVDTIMVAVQGGYGDYFDGKTFDFRNNPSRLADLVAYVINNGFTPIVMVGTADGGTHKEIYDGTMSKVLQALVPFADKGWFCSGYEQDLDRGGGYSSRQIDDALILMRDILGTEALLLLWLQPNRCTPASYWGSDKNHKPSTPDWNPIELKWITSDSNPNEGAWIEADDPYGGDEQGAYYLSGGLEIDGIYYQTDHGQNGPSYASPGGQPGLDSHGQPRYKDRLIECADRFLARGTPMPGAKGHVDGSGITHTSDVCPSTSAPDWFASGRDRGRPLFIVGETVPYEYIRNQCCDEAVSDCCRLCESIGFPISGCYRE